MEYNNILVLAAVVGLLHVVLVGLISFNLYNYQVEEKIASSRLLALWILCGLFSTGAVVGGTGLGLSLFFPALTLVVLFSRLVFAQHKVSSGEEIESSYSPLGVYLLYWPFHLTVLLLFSGIEYIVRFVLF